MPKNVMCKHCNNYRNNWCEKVCDEPDPKIVRDCRYFWQMTNGDRIRAMTDEELGIFLGEWAENPLSWKRDGTGECLAWLQEPAKEEK